MIPCYYAHATHSAKFSKGSVVINGSSRTVRIYSEDRRRVVELNSTTFDTDGNCLHVVGYQQHGGGLTFTLQRWLLVFTAKDARKEERRLS